MKYVIRWTTQEKAALITETVKLVQNNNYKLLDAFRQAQNTVFEPDRRRKLSTLPSTLPILLSLKLKKLLVN